MHLMLWSMSYVLLLLELRLISSSWNLLQYSLLFFLLLHSQNLHNVSWSFLIVWIQSAFSIFYQHLNPFTLGFYLLLPKSFSILGLIYVFTIFQVLIMCKQICSHDFFLTTTSVNFLQTASAFWFHLENSYQCDGGSAFESFGWAQEFFSFFSCLPSHGFRWFGCLGAFAASAFNWKIYN